MSNIDKIRQEFERRIKSCDATSKTPNQLLWAELSALLPFLDTLEEPEQPTRGYDEAYLNEKIAKASKTWKGVDVDEYMDKVREREPVSEDLEEEYKEYVDNDPVYSKLVNHFAGMSIARHFYELGLNARKEENK